MILHIYNPEHDIALGKDTGFFTPPKAARLTREAFCHRPALWAENGDWVLVDDISIARRNLDAETLPHADVRFVSKEDIRKLKSGELPERIEPWGWDKYLVAQLLRYNPLLAPLLPSRDQLEEIRRLSSRQFVAENILPELLSSDSRLTGEMTVCRSEEDILNEIEKHGGSIVLKSPWSCSGRGVRFVSGSPSASLMGWIRNILSEQGAVMAEPLYNKVLDFAMEFHARKTGEETVVEYKGLNVFATRNGAYVGNISGTQAEKKAMILEHIPDDLFQTLQGKIIFLVGKKLRALYEGPFGIDMMIVETPEKEKKVHPCVEMNLRRTMGQFT